MEQVIKEFELDNFEHFSRAVDYGANLFFKSRQPIEQEYQIPEKKIKKAYEEIQKYKNSIFRPFIVAFDTETSIVGEKPTIILSQFTFNQNVMDYMSNQKNLYRFIYKEMDNTNTSIFYDTKTTIKVIKSLPNRTYIPVHNLKYDYSYLIREFLLDPTIEIEEIRTDIALYSVTIKYKDKTFYFYDTAKQFPTTLRKIGDLIGEPKQETYYPMYFKSQKDIVMSKKFLEYGRQDTRVLLKAVETTFLFDYYKNNGIYLTSGGFAYHQLKSEFTNNDFYEWFPPYDTRKEKEVETEFKTYKGGLVYVNPKIQNQLQKNIHIKDATSMYPDKMRNRKMAYGKPRTIYKNFPDIVKYLTENKDLEKCDKAYFYFVTLKGTFSKENIILLNSHEKNEYLKAFNKTVTTAYDFPSNFTIAVTDYELQQLLKFAENVEFQNTVKTIETKKRIFPEIVRYMDKGFELKANNSHDKGNPALREYAKLLINSPYGKFGTRRTLKSFKAELDDFNEVQIVENEENLAGEYVLFASYVTGMARAQLLSMIAEVEVFYTDTDSIHLPEKESINLQKIMPEMFDDDELGKFKHENTAVEGIYSQPKTYIEKIKNMSSPEKYKKHNGKDYYDVHCCGLNNIDHLTTETFLNERIEVVLKSKSTSYGTILKNQLVYVNYKEDNFSPRFKTQNRKVRKLQEKLDARVKKIWLNCKTVEDYEKADEKIKLEYQKIREVKL